MMSPVGAPQALASARRLPRQQQQKVALGQQAAAPASKTPAPSKKQENPQEQKKKSVQKAQPPQECQARSQKAEREAGQKVQLRGSGGDSLEQWEAEEDVEALQPKLRAALEVFQQGRLDVRIFME